MDLGILGQETELVPSVQCFSLERHFDMTNPFLHILYVLFLTNPLLHTEITTLLNNIFSSLSFSYGVYVQCFQDLRQNAGSVFPVFCVSITRVRRDANMNSVGL